MQDFRRHALEVGHLSRRFAIISLVLVSLFGCRDGADQPTLRIAITTSMRDSGIADRLIPAFESQENCEVIVLAVGTGAALKLGENGDVDAIFAHSPAAEQKFVAAGHGVSRQAVMTSDFLIAGPKGDEAEIKGLEAHAALQKIKAKGSTFLSRGDDSGTHKKELALWESAGGLKPWSEYIESGRGMGASAVMAHELRAYILVDRGTFARLAKRLDLVELVSGGENLENLYSVIRVNPDRRPAEGLRLAEAFASFLTGETAQKIISEYEVSGIKVFRAATAPMVEGR